jgi:hypothetical protein
VIEAVPVIITETQLISLFKQKSEKQYKQKVIVEELNQEEAE